MAAESSTHRPCPLCGASALEVLTELTLPQPSGSPLPDTYRLLGCAHCDFAFADTPAPQSAYDLYYQTQAKYAGATGTGAGQNTTDARRLQALATRLTPWLPHTHTRVLDIGCGGGGLLQALRDTGHTHCQGLDPDPAAVATAQAMGLHVTQGLLSAVPTLFTGQRFDLIVLSHVAEHVRDLDWVARLQQLLAPQGALYVEVPNPDHYEIGARPKNYYFDSEHINHFGRNALIRLMASAQLMLSAFVDCWLPLPDGTLYPALAGVGMADPQVTPPVAERTTLDHLRRYIGDCASQARDVPDVSPPLPDNVPLLVWGAGSLAQRLLGQGAIPLSQVVGFLDGNANKHGLTLANKPICSPADGLRKHPTAHVLVCIAIDPHQIERNLPHSDGGQAPALHFFNTLT